MKLIKLGAPRAVILHNDDAFEDSCQNPGAAPERGEDESEESFAARVDAYPRALERYEAFKRYTETYDFAHLEPYIRPGAKPVVFKVRPLPPEAMAAMLDVKEMGQRYVIACRYGIAAIENLATEDENGKPGIHKSKTVDGEYGHALDDDSMQIFRDPAILVEVALQVFTASRVPKGVSKSG